MAIQKRNEKISVVGLGKLGSCLAACLASKNFSVLGFDIEGKTVQSINAHQAPVTEPGLQELIEKSAKNLRATLRVEDILSESDITFIIVPTPSQEDGNFSDRYIKDFFSAVAPSLKKKKTHHIFVINSTVTPMTTEKSLIPFLEKKSGKKIDMDFSVCYNPEFIALGDVVSGILHPDVVLIGEGNKKSGDRLEKIYRKLCENDPYIARISIVSAEIMKIALNSFVTMKISFANTLGRICEHISNANVDDITRALGADKRISPHYLKAGLPFGGPCFPRDNRAFRAFAQSLGIEAPLAFATDQTRTLHLDALSEKIGKLVKKNKHRSVSVIGLSYKPHTGVIEESAAIKIIQNIQNQYPNIRINVFDPLAREESTRVLGPNVYYAPSLTDCLNQSGCWIVTSPEEAYTAACYRHPDKDRATIVDCWRALDKNKLGKAKYFSVGGNF